MYIGHNKPFYLSILFYLVLSIMERSSIVSPKSRFENIRWGLHSFQESYFLSKYFVWLGLVSQSLLAMQNIPNACFRNTWYMTPFFVIRSKICSTWSTKPWWALSKYLTGSKWWTWIKWLIEPSQIYPKKNSKTAYNHTKTKPLYMKPLFKLTNVSQSSSQQNTSATT